MPRSPEGAEICQPPPEPCRLSVVLPVHNEALAIRENLRSLDAALVSRLGHTAFELILVDNASADGTPAVLEALRPHVPRARRIWIAEKGRGRALKAGYQAARADLVAVLSIDRAWEEAFVTNALRRIEAGAAIVLGQKTHPESTVRRSWRRRWASRLVQAFISLLFVIRPQDTQCVKVFRKSAIPFLFDLQSNHYFAEAEFFLRAKRSNLRCEAIGVDVSDYRPNSKVTWFSLLEFLAEALRFRLAGRTLERGA